MDALVHRRAADVHPDRPGGRRKLDEAARKAVVQAHRSMVLRSSAARSARASASSRESAASTAASSGPVAAPVSASRSERRSPPTAFSSRRIARAPSVSSFSGAGPSKLVETVESRAGLGVERDRRRLENEPAHTRALRPACALLADTGTASAGASAASSQLLVAHGGDRIRREPPEPGKVEVDVVLRKPELVEVRPDRLRREAFLAQLGDRGVPVPLGELLPVGAEHEPVVDHLRELAADRAGDALVQLEIGAVIGASYDVRDPELEVVHDRGELIRRRAVRAQKRRSAARVAPRPRLAAAAPESSARPAASAYRLPRSLCRTGPSSKPTRSQERSSIIASSPPVTVRAGSVSSMRRMKTPPSSSANRRFATAVSAFPRCSEPVGLGANRTRTGTTPSRVRGTGRSRGRAPGRYARASRRPTASRRSRTSPSGGRAARRGTGRSSPHPCRPA